MSLTLPTRTTGPLRTVAAAWLVGLAPSALLVHRAAELLAETDDSESFLAVAALPLNPDVDDLRAALFESFRSADDLALEGDVVGLLALRWACGETLADRMTARELCMWAAGYSMWHGPEVFAAFEELEIEFEEASYLDGRADVQIAADARVAAIAHLQDSTGLEV